MNDHLQHTYAVILAGGAGARFWPLSRELHPKQLLSIFGTHSLIVQAVQRIAPLLGQQPRSVRVVTNERLYPELNEHLAGQQDLPDGSLHFLVEPAGRNTAPAIALAAAELAREDPDALMVVLPSDHLCDDGEEWGDAIRAALLLAADGYLATIGLRPTRTETGFGYIEIGEPLPAYAVGSAQPHQVAQFVEKPSAEVAAEFVESGRFLWNAGIFVVSAAGLLEQMRLLTPLTREIAETCMAIAAVPRECWFEDAVRERFAALASVSIDYAFVEQAHKVAVIPARLEWNDVGSLLALGTLAPEDDASNVRVGRGVDVDSHGCIVYAPERLVATVGVRDLVVVDTFDATLICPKDRCQDVRRVAEYLKTSGAEELVEARSKLRPWGQWTTLLKGEQFQIKILELHPGMGSNVQCHGGRSEHWVVLEGTARVTRDGGQTTVSANESIFIPPGTTHRLENPGKTPLRIIEVQVGEELGDYAETDGK